jgi:hypothetical protein
MILSVLRAFQLFGQTFARDSPLMSSKMSSIDQDRLAAALVSCPDEPDQRAFEIEVISLLSHTEFVELLQNYPDTDQLLDDLDEDWFRQWTDNGVALACCWDYLFPNGWPDLDRPKVG